MRLHFVRLSRPFSSTDTTPICCHSVLLVLPGVSSARAVAGRDPLQFGLVPYAAPCEPVLESDTLSCGIQYDAIRGA